jgi:hypothetical protein
MVREQRSLIGDCSDPLSHDHDSDYGGPDAWDMIVRGNRESITPAPNPLLSSPLLASLARPEAQHAALPAEPRMSSKVKVCT